MEGYKRIVAGDTHRKELVAGGLADYMTNRRLPQNVSFVILIS
jgi:hypothetical protein